MKTKTIFSSFAKKTKTNSGFMISMILRDCWNLKYTLPLTCVLCWNRCFCHAGASHCSLKEHVHIVNSLTQHASFSLSSADDTFNFDIIVFY